MMRKYKILVSATLLLALSFVGYVGLANAHDFRSGTNVVVEGSEKIDHTLFAAGNSVNVSSEVFGDVFCAGQTVTISGTVHGDVICAGQTVTVSGTVDGDVRLAGQSITVGGKVAGNATIAGQSFTLSSTASIGGDVTLGSADGNLSGTIGRDIAAGGGNLVIANAVGRDIKGNIENLRLSSGARVQGNIDFTSSKDLEKANGAIVAGKVTRTEASKEESKGGFEIKWFIYCLLALLTAAMALTLLFPRMLHNVTSRAFPRPWKALFTGFVASLAVPVFLIVIAITVVGLPLAIMGGLVWLAVAMLSGPIFGYYLGRIILKKSRQPLLIMLVGASALVLLYFIPIIGLIALLIAFWGGAGMLLLELFHRTPRPVYAIADPAPTATKKKK